MFGYRPDGRAIKNVDPIVRMTSLIMPQRNDAQVFCKINIDYDILNDYVREQRLLGNKISHMNVIVAAFVRAVSKRPEFNRFICNKKIYERNELCVSYSILKETSGGEVLETTVKVKFNPEDTIYDVARKMDVETSKLKKMDNNSFTDKLAAFFLSIPLIPGIAVNFVKLLDRYGLLPKVIIDASPFHTSMFITNMASIKMDYVYHHIYNFGTTSIFIAMGKKHIKIDVDKDNNIIKRRVMTLGFVIDERICSGAVYASGLATLEKYLKNPSLLEAVEK